MKFKIKKMLGKIRRGNYSFYYSFFPIKNNKITFCNYYGKGYGDSGKAIVESLSDEIDIDWIVSDLSDESLPSHINKIKYGTFSHLRSLATSKVWIDNSRKDFYPPKKKKQTYIQNWHGGIALKKIEKDAINTLDKGYIKMAKEDSKMIDIFTSNSRFNTDMIKRSFWFEKEILEVGTPRCDILVNENKVLISNIKSNLNVSDEDFIVLYAPTFRQNHRLDVYNLDLKRIKKRYEKLTSKNIKILVRLHPNISHLSEKLQFNSNYDDVTSYPDLYELMLVSDVLITDYSSTMFDFSITEKPVVLYVPDFCDYQAERDVYFDLNELPFVLLESNNQIESNIISENNNEKISDLRNFHSLVGLNETGRASDEIAKRIQEILR